MFRIIKLKFILIGLIAFVFSSGIDSINKTFAKNNGCSVENPISFDVYHTGGNIVVHYTKGCEITEYLILENPSWLKEDNNMPVDGILTYKIFPNEVSIKSADGKEKLVFAPKARSAKIKITFKDGNTGWVLITQGGTEKKYHIICDAKEHSATDFPYRELRSEAQKDANDHKKSFPTHSVAILP